eukprot:TRINITY_DN781842_c0_g1_i1.p1 TRINITY_DN781842_c0_g1~~TRINITY_DN781842_c0_g1_i1.p1  ORF type:complete len:634 (-),score=159.92 TRINITY_DN781842_c0_g1_i1:162-2063(-)
MSISWLSSFHEIYPPHATIGIIQQGLIEKYGDKFIDESFPASGEALYCNPALPPMGSVPEELVCWCRVSDYELLGCDGPYMFLQEGSIDEDGISMTGQALDDWFINAISFLYRTGHLNHCMVADNKLEEGIVTIKFYKEGIWRNVHVDDQIPCNVSTKPLYAFSSQHNEMWPLFMEKAYAKLHGCYENLNGGYMPDVLLDCTGLPSYRMPLTHPFIDSLHHKVGGFYNWIKQLIDDRHIVSASYIGPKRPIGVVRMGIIDKQPYVILEAVKIAIEEKGKSTYIYLLKIQTGRGGPCGWKGNWSETSRSWDDAPEVKTTLGPRWHVPKDQSWIELGDFLAQFREVTVCMTGLSTSNRANFEMTWSITAKPPSNGGYVHHDSFLKNPQMPFEVTEDTKVTVMIEQPDLRWRHGHWKDYKASCGVVCLKLSNEETQSFQLIGYSQYFTKSRTSVLEFKVDSGTYILIPAQDSPQSMTTNFNISIFSDKRISFMRNYFKKYTIEKEEFIPGGGKNKKKMKKQQAADVVPVPLVRLFDWPALLKAYNEEKFKSDPMAIDNNGDNTIIEEEDGETEGILDEESDVIVTDENGDLLGEPEHVELLMDEEEEGKGWRELYRSVAHLSQVFADIKDSITIEG